MSETEITVHDAEGVLRREYWETVRRWAGYIKDELKEQIKAGVDGEALREWLLEYIQESLDSASDVIYTRQAQKVLLFSENQDAYAENCGSEGMVQRGVINWSALAYWALEADVYEQLAAEDIDVNDPDSDETHEALGLAVETTEDK